MKTRRGFTIVELMVVIVIIVTLSLITVFAFGSWRKRTARTEMRQELTTVAASLNTYRTFNNVYPGTAGGAVVDPTTISGLTYKANANVSVTYALRSDGASFCLKATSVSVSSASPWYIDSTTNGDTPTTTACS